jgi:hypothetical protein
MYKLYYHGHNSAVGIATGYKLDDKGAGFLVPVGARNFISPCHPDWFWGLPSLLSNGNQGLLPQGLSGRSMKLTTHLQPVLKVKKTWVYTSTPQYVFKV